MNWLDKYSDETPKAQKGKKVKPNIVKTQKSKLPKGVREVTQKEFDRINAKSPLVKVGKDNFYSNDTGDKVVIKEKTFEPRQTQENINITSQGLAQTNTELIPNLNIIQQARIPKYFKVTDKVNQPFGGTETNYQVYPDQDFPSMSTQTYSDGTPMNTRQVVPVYIEGGQISVAQNGIEGTMGGLTDKGFNYNGAWGGQFQDGGILSIDQDDVSEDAMRGMIKSKIGMGNAFNHPAIKRMSQVMPKTGMTPEGIGTHYMSSVDNYAVPLLQDLGEEELILVDPDPRSREAIRFNSPEEAEYFAKHYKEVAPMSTIFKDFNSFQTGGSIPGSVGFTYARTKGIPSEGPYAKKTMPSAQNGQEMRYYQHGLDFTPKTISKKGSVIKDDLGQWAHPGEITEIGSNNITMEGVPYPVLGISDEGDMKLMQPGKNYKFKGKKVTEFPMAKNGINNLDAKPLQKLDDLTNFTNYNSSSDRGWLSKYK